MAECAARQPLFAFAPSENSHITCCINTLMVRSGMSPGGILRAPRCRHSLGGMACKNRSSKRNKSLASSDPFLRSTTALRDNFQMHLSTSSACLASRLSAVVSDVAAWLRRRSSWNNELQDKIEGQSAQFLGVLGRPLTQRRPPSYPL